MSQYDYHKQTLFCVLCLCIQDPQDGQRLLILMPPFVCHARQGSVFWLLTKLSYQFPDFQISKCPNRSQYWSFDVATL